MQHAKYNILLQNAKDTSNEVLESRIEICGLIIRRGFKSVKPRNPLSVKRSVSKVSWQELRQGRKELGGINDRGEVMAHDTMILS